jgi:hypothetical protein
MIFVNALTVPYGTDESDACTETCSSDRLIRAFSRCGNLKKMSPSGSWPCWQRRSAAEVVGLHAGIQLFGTCTEVSRDDVGEAERVCGTWILGVCPWKAVLKPGDPAGQYRFDRFVPERVKIRDEADFAVLCRRKS